MMRQQQASHDDQRWDSTSSRSSGGSTRASSSCAACKMLKRRCRASCIFAPYFRSDEGTKFAKVHKVFGASNVSKLLVEVPPEHREDAVNSLAYEAEARLLDPVYGCIGAIAILHTRLSHLSQDLALARARLARYNQLQSQSVVAAASAADYGSSSSSTAATGYYDYGASVNVNDSDDSAVYDYGFVPYIL